MKFRSLFLLLIALTFATIADGEGGEKIGPAMIGNDGMILDYVPAGKFTIGSKAEDALAECKKYQPDCVLGNLTNEEPLHEVNLDAYWIDQTEVTNKMYAKCVAENKCRHPNTKSRTRPNYYGNPEFDNYPVLGVSWDSAKNYCSWAGRRLPTEAEWEKAARGTDARTYPWGEGIDCTKANYQASCVGDTSAVGSYKSGRSPYGAYDMAGNVWEWVSSLYKPYPYDANDGRENLNSSGDRVLRGGSWVNLDINLRSALRAFGDPTYSDISVGFRCARSP